MKWWDKFWFESENLIGQGIARIILGLTLLYMQIMKSWNLDFYRADGVIPREESIALLNEQTRPLWSWTLWSDANVLPVHVGLIIALVLFTLGIGGRIVSAICFILMMGFIHRNYAVLFGADVIAVVLMLCHIMSPGDRALSVKSYLRRHYPGLWHLGRLKTYETLSLWFHSIGYRFLQIQVLCIYTYTGFEKLRGPSWWNGTAIWTVLMNPQMAVMDFSFVRALPLIVGFMTFATIAFEVYFMPAMLNRRLRLPWLLAGIGFHMGIGLFMDLMAFSLVMLSTYALFIRPEEWQLVRNRLSQTGKS